MKYFFDCITMILNATLCFSILFKKYTLNKNNLKLRIICTLSIIIIKGLILYFHIPPLNFISGCLVITGVIKIWFNCNYTSLITYSALFSMLMLSADAFGVIIVSAFHEKTINVTLESYSLLWQHHLWNWLIQCILARIAGIIIKKNENFKIKWHEIFFYVMLISFEVGIFVYFSYTAPKISSGFVFSLILVGFLILNLYITYIFHKISVWRENEQQIALMQQQEQLHLQMYKELQEQYQTTCEVAHDINRHIKNLKLWIDERNEQGTNTYLTELYNVTRKLQPRIKNQNSMLEIILNTMAAKCEKEGINMNMEIEDFSMDFISDMDITTIFSNLLDNAFDACMDVESKKKSIQIILCRRMNLIALRIVNPRISEDTIIPQIWHSTKKEHKGIGLSNVKKAVEKYDGVLSIQLKPNIFQVSVTIPII